jgi:hypothetical protein
MTSNGKKGLLRVAKDRSRRVVADVREAMALIEVELQKNDGLYLRNKGRLTMAEVCRRAGVHPITMMGATHKKTTRPMIQAWIRKVSKSMVVGRASIRKTVAKSANDWKAKYMDLASQFKAMYSVEIPRRDADLKKATERIALPRRRTMTCQSPSRRK